MSTDSNDFDVTKEANDLRSALLGFDGVSDVSGPHIRSQGGRQHVSFGIAFSDEVEHPDVKFNNELGTYLSMYLGSSEDWWFTNDMPGYYGVVNAFGLNPDAGSNVGAHSF